MNIKVLKSWTLRVAVFGLLINEPLLFPSVAISQDTHVSSPITTLQDKKPLPSDFVEIPQDTTILSLITTLREIDNTERQSPYKDCYYNSDFSIFDSNCELKDKNELLTYMSEEAFERIVRALPSKENIPAVSYLSEKELVRLEGTLEKLIERGTISILPLRGLLKDIQKWWEIIFCVYTMISLNSPAFLSLNQSLEVEHDVVDNTDVQVSNHEQWNHECGWKNVLNNLRLLIQPIMMLWLIFPWLDIFPNSKLLLGFNQLIGEINQCQSFLSSG